jgi:hypothetical protein
MQAHQDETSHVYTYQGSQGVVFAGVVFVVFYHNHFSVKAL